MKISFLIQNARNILAEEGGRDGMAKDARGEQTPTPDYSVITEQRSNGVLFSRASMSIVAAGIGAVFVLQTNAFDGLPPASEFIEKARTVLFDTGYVDQQRPETIHTKPPILGEVAGLSARKHPPKSKTLEPTDDTKPTTSALKLDKDQYRLLKQRLDGKTTNPAAINHLNGNPQRAEQHRKRISSLVANSNNAKSDNNGEGTSKVATVNLVDNVRQLEAAADDTASVNSEKFASENRTATAERNTADGLTDQLGLLTNNVVRQLTELKNAEDNQALSAAPETRKLRLAINNLVHLASAQNLGSKAIEDLLNDALENSNAVPKALAGPDGKLDTQLLLKSVLSSIDVNKVKQPDKNYYAALEDEGNSTVITPAILASTPLPAIDENNRIKYGVSGARLITVEAGDTLSSLAFLIYGDVLDYPKLFNANRNVLENINSLNIGTVLRVP